MPRTAAATKPRTFHATLHVTRIEHWSVEASSKAEAVEKLGALTGDCAHIGPAVHYELDALDED
jgi:hypothetical protein